MLLDEDFIIRNGRKKHGSQQIRICSSNSMAETALKEIWKWDCLLDATYRTTKYSLPLYFLCVRSNANYMTVTTFILETEDSFSIQEALSIIKAWNPDWKPAHFMCDYAEEEISAIESVFTEAFVYLWLPSGTSMGTMVESYSHWSWKGQSWSLNFAAIHCKIKNCWRVWHSKNQITGKPVLDSQQQI